jgi:hypothetical protein
VAGRADRIFFFGEIIVLRKIKSYICNREIKQNINMAAITLNYDGRNTLIKSILRSAILAGATEVCSKKRTPLDEALEDLRLGRITTIHTPRQWKSEKK